MQIVLQLSEWGISGCRVWSHHTTLSLSLSLFLPVIKLPSFPIAKKSPSSFTALSSSSFARKRLKIVCGRKKRIKKMLHGLVESCCLLLRIPRHGCTFCFSGMNLSIAHDRTGHILVPMGAQWVWLPDIWSRWMPSHFLRFIGTGIKTFSPQANWCQYIVKGSLTSNQAPGLFLSYLWW